MQQNCLKFIYSVISLNISQVRPVSYGITRFSGTWFESPVVTVWLWFDAKLSLSLITQSSFASGESKNDYEYVP